MSNPKASQTSSEDRTTQTAYGQPQPTIELVDHYNPVSAAKLLDEGAPQISLGDPDAAVGFFRPRPEMTFVTLYLSERWRKVLAWTIAGSMAALFLSRWKEIVAVVQFASGLSW